MAEGRSNVSRFFEIHKVYRKDPDGSMKLCSSTSGRITRTANDG